jgi:glutathione S-transferase
MDAVLSKLQNHLSSNNFKFVCGNQISIADYVIFAELQDTKYLKKDMSAYPTLASYE